ncbi:unnamed protein product [Ranitomeya imitator]|uniref:Alkaline ceramidase n=1 Tax=Ranitomeya imitator TaxID=111125 RepID=A0ABN9KPJ9_9NEOB|nr:unnamed protein product [Ranitomeya imitator]
MAPALDRPGYWGPPTSTLDWCEENYAVSYYIAEFWNTVSNLIMILPPICGAIQTVNDKLETRYLMAFLGLAAVGMGSWFFHMTLQYEMQLLDELPMIYSCSVFVYCLYECFKFRNSYNYLLLVLLMLFSVIVTTVYLQWKEPVFHQVMYGVLVGFLVLRSDLDPAVPSLVGARSPELYFVARSACIVMFDIKSHNASNVFTWSENDNSQSILSYLKIVCGSFSFSDNK